MTLISLFHFLCSLRFVPPVFVTPFLSNLKKLPTSLRSVSFTWYARKLLENIPGQGLGRLAQVLGPACVVGARSISPRVGVSSGVWVAWPGSLDLPLWWVLGL